jgi:hypothetical protein
MGSVEQVESKARTGIWGLDDVGEATPLLEERVQ